jgi:fructokinase
MKPLVVGIGELLWDLLPGGKQLGGAPANFAYHAQCLGAQGIVVSSVGDDPAGHEILQALQQLGLRTQYVWKDPAYPTGTVRVTVDAQGLPRYEISHQVAWDFRPQEGLLDELAARADAVCYGSLAQRSPVTRRTIREFLNATRPQCLRVFDVNLRQSYYDREVIHELLQLSNVFKLNDEELPILARLLDLPSDEVKALNTVLDRYPLKLLALTRGAHGSRLQTPSECSELPSESVTVVDTVGAGDAFTAAVTMGLLQRQDLSTLHQRASKLAGYICTQRGATPKMINV